MSKGNAYPFVPAKRITKNRAAIYSQRQTQPRNDGKWARVWRIGITGHQYAIGLYDGMYFERTETNNDLDVARALARQWAGVDDDGAKE